MEADLEATDSTRHVVHRYRDGFPRHRGSARSLSAAVDVAWTLHPKEIVHGYGLQDFTITRIIVNDNVHHPETFFAAPDPDALYSLDDFRRCWRKAGDFSVRPQQPPARQARGSQAEMVLGPVYLNLARSTAIFWVFRAAATRHLTLSAYRRHMR